MNSFDFNLFDVHHHYHHDHHQIRFEERQREFEERQREERDTEILSKIENACTQLQSFQYYFGH